MRSRARLCFTPAERSCAYTRILVSTKHLSLMQFVAGARRGPAQIEALLQAAETCGATLVYSEDFAVNQRYGSIRIVNPLTDSFASSRTS